MLKVRLLTKRNPPTIEKLFISYISVNSLHFLYERTKERIEEIIRIETTMEKINLAYCVASTIMPEGFAGTNRTNNPSRT